MYYFAVASLFTRWCLLPSKMTISRNQFLSTHKNAYFAKLTNIQRAFCANKRTEIAVGQRILGHNERIAHIMTRSLGTMRQIQNRNLMDAWPGVVRDIQRMNQNIPDVNERLTRALEYNVLGGKNERALSTLYAYELLMPANRKTQENDHLARILAWCTVILDCFILILDDIQDHSLTRCNRLCWYRYEDIGLTAINDAVLIKCAVYRLLEMYFGEKDCYINILEIFQKSIMKISVGQCLDLYNFNNKPDLNQFTMDRYDSIVYHKTAYYACAVPVAIAMHFVGIKDQELFRKAAAILLKIGYLFQVQNDYLDCYGDNKIVGKIGNDIEEGKCTWLVVTALQRATPAQRDILKECYGSTDPENVKRVKQLYNELDLPRIYSTYAKETCDCVNNDIEQMSSDLPQELFRQILNDFYHQNK